MEGGYHIRSEDDEYDLESIFQMYQTCFSINFHHRGYFTSVPGRRYVNGVITLIDLLCTDRFSIQELEQIRQELGYPNGIRAYFHYRQPGEDDLDVGIHPIVDEYDVQNVVEIVLGGVRIIDVFVEHGDTNIYPNQTEIPIVLYEDHNDEDWEDNSEDSDYVDENNEMEESDVDMRDFRFSIDQDDSGNRELQLLGEMEDEVLDNDEFESYNYSEDIGNIRNRTLKLHKRVYQDDGDFYIGQQFASKEDVKTFLRRYTIESRRLLKTVKDDAKRVRVQCEGKIPGVERVKPDGDNGGIGGANKGGRGKKANPNQYLCPFVLLVSKDVITDTWMVKTLNSSHRCVQSRHLKALTSTFLSQELMDQIEENPNIPVKAVQEQYSKKFELSISKYQAFRARSKAQKQLHGDYNEQYGLLREYCDELMRRNLGTTVKIEVEHVSDPDSTIRKFKRIYICLGSLKEGFKAIGREMLGLDGAFMKGPYPGQILSAVGVDPNNGIYPVAFAIVESENIHSWTWFLECVGDDLDLSSNSNFTFISDRQKGILQAITKLYPCAEHRFCLRHIHENMKVEGYKGNAFKELLWKIATATTVMQFERHMESLKEMNANAHLWLSKIHPKHWSRSHFSGRAHSDILLNNICEVFNSKILDGRDKPIVTALEYIREYLMRRVVNVLQVIDRTDGPLTPYASKQFDIIKKEATKFVVTWNGGDEYQVAGPSGFKCVVNVALKSCTCRRWEITGIPCKHAVATNWNMAAFGQQVDIPENWVHPIYKLETWKNVYNFKVFPINGKCLWLKSKVPFALIPPTHHKQVGRPKKKRKKSGVELEEVTKCGRLSKKNMTVTCGKCKQVGHNIRTCNGPSQSVATGSASGAVG